MEWKIISCITWAKHVSRIVIKIKVDFIIKEK